MARRAVAIAAVLLAACAPSPGSGQPSPAPAVPASQADLGPHYGSYAMADHDIVVIARMGWYFDLHKADYRTIYTGGSPGHFTIGRAFERPQPKFADLVFGDGTLTISGAGRTRTGKRIDYKETEVKVPAGDATLAAAITVPNTAGLHPGIVIVHGSERGERFIYDIWVGLYASLGLAVLTYDKRGVGASTGTYPGEFPTDSALATYADDASAALNFLAHQPQVDPSRVGFHGGSQGGWTVPLAMQRHSGAAFAVLVSAPATTVDQTVQWKDFSGGGESLPAESMDQMLAAVRATHSGYDPLPALRALTAPALWLLGTNDRTVPTAVCVEILSSLHKANFTVQMLPTGHGLLVNPTGLLADDSKSTRLAPQLVPEIKAWLAQVT